MQGAFHPLSPCSFHPAVAAGTRLPLPHYRRRGSTQRSGDGRLSCGFLRPYPSSSRASCCCFSCARYWPRRGVPAASQQRPQQRHQSPDLVTRFSAGLPPLPSALSKKRAAPAAATGRLQRCFRASSNAAPIQLQHRFRVCSNTAPEPVQDPHRKALSLHQPLLPAQSLARFSAQWDW